MGSETGESETQRISAECGNPLGKLFPGGSFDGLRLHWIHQAGRAFGDQFRQRDAVDEVQWIKHVTFGFAHLMAFGIADQSGYVDFPERHFAGEVQGHHHHACDPEENDIEPGDKDRCWQKRFEFRRFLGPAER